MVSAGAFAPHESIEEMRAASWTRVQQWGVPGPDVHSVSERLVPGGGGELPARIYMPGAVEDGPYPALLYMHGGGWVFGGLYSADAACRLLANAARCVVVNLAYRHAPEDKFPAAVEDAYAAVCWLVATAPLLGVDASRVGVGGLSAGANLAAAACIVARDRGGPDIAVQVLLNGAFDVTGTGIAEHEDDFTLTPASARWHMRHYVRDDADARHPHASPALAAHHRGLPPAVIVVAELDPLRPQQEEYARMLLQAEVPVTLRRYAAMVHGFLMFSGHVDAADRAMVEVAADLRSAFNERAIERSGSVG